MTQYGSYRTVEPFDPPTQNTIRSVNDTDYRLSSLTNGEIQGHSRTGTNILVNSPVNNTEYICVSLTNDGETRSQPSYIIIAGEHTLS